MNDKRYERLKGKGPIPSRDFIIDVNKLTNPGIIGDILRNTRGDWGDWRVPIEPCSWTNTFGRSGFFLHGGREPGSAGCIDIGGGLFGDKDSDRVLKSLKSDPDKKVTLTVFTNW